MVSVISTPTQRVIAMEARDCGVYFVRVSRALAAEMGDWSDPVQVRFEVDEHRDGEGVLVWRKVET
jgi:hypothetical protein